MYIIIILLLVIICIILLIKNHNIKKNISNQIKEEYIEKHKNTLNLELDKYRQELAKYMDTERRNAELAAKQFRNEAEQERRILQERQEAAKTVIVTLEQKEQIVQQAIRELEDKQKIALRDYDLLLEEKKKAKRLEIDTQLAAEAAQARTEALTALGSFLTTIDAQKLEAQQQIDELQAILTEYQEKTKTVNEAILRQRAIEEQQDFYRVVLDETAISDVGILMTIREKLIFREIFDKLIYDAYVSKPVTEMTKRVLGGRAPTGVYKITRLKTGEVYIGKSTDVKKRWTEHCKTAYGVGTIAHSILHTTIKKDGIENFTFELLEEVPKDKLTEREKYWITFYGSKEYGLNERIG